MCLSYRISTEMMSPYDNLIWAEMTMSYDDHMT